MTVTLYSVTIPQFDQMLGTVAGLVDKAEAWCKEQGCAPAELIEARLAPDMHPFSYQVKSTVVHSLGAIEGVRAGSFSPDNTTPPDSFDAMRAMLSDARAKLAAMDAEEINALDGRDMAFQAGPKRLPFTAEGFLLSFSKPSLYFHATAAYAILRNKGVPVGKLDYLGKLALKA